jgi:hypothetical protein
MAEIIKILIMGKIEINVNAITILITKKDFVFLHNKN